MKEALATDLSERVKVLKNLSDKLTEIELLKKRVQDTYDQVEQEIMRMLEGIGVKSLNVAGAGQVILTEPQVKAYFRGERREDAIKWLKDNGQAHIVAETVNHHNLNRVIKEKLTNGEAFPEDLIGYNFIRQLQLRK